MIVFDTDVLSILQVGSGLDYERLRARLDSDPDPARVITVISFDEQVRGCFGLIAGRSDAASLVHGYGWMQKVLGTFCDFRVLAFDDAAASAFADLRREHRRRGANDLKIAAITLVRGGRLLTRNVRDFEDIRGLTVIPFR